MNLLYDIGIACYRAAVGVASLKNRKARLMLKGQKQTFKRLRGKLDPEGGYIWMHVSSLGEFEQGRPLIEMIRARDPKAKIVLSFFSPSGYEVRKNYAEVDAVCYLPFDTVGNAKRFLDIVKPKMAIFVKYEFWGNYLTELHRRHVPTYLISAIFRPGQVFFRPWGSMFRKMIRCFDTLFVQNEQSRRLLGEIGISSVEVCGDTRFDRVMHVKEQAKHVVTVDRFVENAKMTMVVGSSWEPDEDLAINYFNTHPDLKLILAPHEFDRQRLLSIMSRITRPAGLLSVTPTAKAKTLDCVIVDSFGLLSSLYRYGQLAMVGGGFGSGIHNINEAAVYGIPVIIGPNHSKFREATDLIDRGGCFEVNNQEEFNAIMDRLTGDADFLAASGNAASDYIQTQLGATQFIYDRLFPPVS